MASAPRPAGFALARRKQAALTCMAAPLVLVCAAGCTREAADDEPALPARQIDDSGEDRALSFDGVDDYATSATAAFPDGLSTQTASLWFQLDDVAGKQAFLTLRKDLDSGVELGVSDGLVGAFRVFADRTLAIAKVPVTAHVWHHAAYVFDGVMNQVYVDGVLAGTSEDMPDKRTPTSCWLGTLDGVGDLLHGSLDDVRVYARARTAAELAAEAARQPPDSAAGAQLVLELPFDEQGGSVVYDHSPHANDGQLGDGIDQRMPARVPSTVPTPGR